MTGSAEFTAIGRLCQRVCQLYEASDAYSSGVATAADARAQIRLLASTSDSVAYLNSGAGLRTRFGPCWG